MYKEAQAQTTSFKGRQGIPHTTLRAKISFEKYLKITYNASLAIHVNRNYLGTVHRALTYVDNKLSNFVVKTRYYPVNKVILQPFLIKKIIFLIKIFEY